MTDPIRKYLIIFNYNSLHQSIVVQAEVILTLAIFIDITLRIIAEKKVYLNFYFLSNFLKTNGISLIWVPLFLF